MTRRSPFLAAALLVLTGCASTASPTGAAAPPATAPATAATTAAAPQEVRHVLAISIDALNPQALRRLGRERAPAIWRLIDGGVHTLNARTARELTDTLPNHTTMVTGRSISRGTDGHEVTWNDERRDPATVQEAAGEQVGSVFSSVGAAGRSAALFSTKEKLRLFDRSWPAGVDRVTIRAGRDAALARAARADLVRHHRAFTFVHLGLADATGHERGFMSKPYLRAVHRLDGLVGSLVHAVRTTPALESTAVVLTADHGGRGASHRDPTRAANYRVPFVVWGSRVGTGDLYDLQRRGKGARYADPGRARTGYAARRQPVRNGDLANLSLDLLGLDPVSDSRFDRTQALRVR